MNLDFEDQRKNNNVDKVLFDLYREREKMKDNGNQDIKTVNKTSNLNVSSGWNHRFLDSFLETMLVLKMVLYFDSFLYY